MGMFTKNAYVLYLFLCRPSLEAYVSFVGLNNTHFISTLQIVSHR